MSNPHRNRQQQLSVPPQRYNNTHDSPYSSSSASTPSHTQQQYAAASMLRLHQGSIPIPTTAPPNINLDQSTDDGYSNTETDGETVNAISNIIDVCNDVDKESYCKNTELAIKRCIRLHIWSNNKFLTDKSMKEINVNDRSNSHSIINILLRFTRKERLNDVHRFRFWKKYGPMVQKELNTLKTIATRGIRTALMPGK